MSTGGTIESRNGIGIDFAVETDFVSPIHWEFAVIFWYLRDYPVYHGDEL